MLYWSAIFQGIGFVYMFFLMEETNYSRKTITGQESQEASGTQTPTEAEKTTTTIDGKVALDTATSAKSTEAGLGAIRQSRKTYLQKMRLFQSDAFTKKNQLLGMVTRPL